MQLDRVPVAYRPPFGMGDMYFSERLPGQSILEIVLTVPDLPRDFLRDGYVCINGEVVPRELWAHVRPKPMREGFHIVITLHATLHDSGGQGGRSTQKSIIGIVAAIALVVVTYGIGAGALIPGLSTAPVFLGISTAQIVAGAVGIAGALAISALTAPPVTSSPVDTGGDNANQAEAAAAQGNILDKSGAIPRVVGTRKVFPPLACEPVVELIDQDEYVEALFVLNGPHKLEDIRIENNPVTAADDIQIETREGFAGDGAVTLVTRQGKTTLPQIELSKHNLQTDGIALSDQGTPANSLPVWHGFASRNSPDEIWVHLLFPGGIYIGNNNLGRVPFRCRIRRKGTTTWINLPEFHILGNSNNQFRGAIVFKFNTAWASPPNPPTTGFAYAHAQPPAQSLSPATPSAWVAHPFFFSGGTPYVFAGNLGNVANIKLYTNRIEVYFDPNQFAVGTFAPGYYEIQIKRGHLIVDGGFSKTTYFYNGFSNNIFDFFWYFTPSGIFGVTQTQINFSDRVLIARVVSIWKQAPLATPGNFALIAVKARNRTIRQLSVTASGYVKDWNGTDWVSSYVTTSNPAPHYVDVLTGSLNLDPLPSTLRGDGDLVIWRGLCRQNGWTCDAIINDMRAQDVLQLLASCGYAKPYQSDRYKVAMDSDHSAQVPVQVFSRRNAANMRFERAFARVPAGFNVTYRDDDLDDDQAQIAVMQRNPANSDMTTLEAVTYDGLTTAERVYDRALFDLDQANLRSTFYYMDVDIESIVCRRGDLVGVEHDILQTRAGDGYIQSKQTSGGNIIGITLDAEIPIVSGTTGIIIRRTDSTLSTHQLSNATGSSKVLTFTTPIADTSAIQGFADNDRRYGCLVVAGDLTTIYRRLLVHTISPSKDLSAQMALVDEAPALVRFPSAKTVALLHMDGSAGSTSFPDATGRHAPFRIGTTVVDTTTAKFGTGTATFSGTGDGIVMDDDSDWYLRDTDFTADFWVFLVNVTTQQVFWSQGDAGGQNYNVCFMDSTGHLIFQETLSAATNFQITGSASSIPINTHTHIAVERYGDLFSVYTAGVARAQVTNSLAFKRKTGYMTIGSFINGNIFSVLGRLDEFRFSRVARYQGVASFTPPVAAYSVD